MIEVTNLVKKYGTHVAVDSLTFTVEKGQIYGFLGPNGAGKSTTMNIITGYLAATGGSVAIDGFDILKKPSTAKKKIGYLPEFPPLYMDMTVSEYLRFAAELKKIKKNERTGMIDDVMELTKITDAGCRLIKNLSKGYKQRVGLAQALLGYPEVLILDEPTSGLDPKQIIEIRDLIKSLGNRHTVILSSHILSEVSAVCDHILILSHGKLVASDTPENLSRRMTGENVLELTVKGKKTFLLNLLNEIEGVKSVELCDAKEEEIIHVLVQTEGSQDIREPLFYCLAEKKCPILEMKQSSMSLEDVFLELTSDEFTEEIEEKEASGYESGL
ncbi:ATP-binding cassette domain-containing protein [bacterium C-53]|nr:ATP-binding cassette domain-containing protein [Lachnospiraceae bacterium]NBI01757.1 ATP-binding cassette domain-containing protein [Lachnospiraceae bacterium]RKJ12177.1 ATP-binding cassette domain-containing protein [bacterium C-53]